MDMFMDKLAQKLTAQEIIRANTAADTEELNRLRNQIVEYNDCLAKLQKLINEGSEKLHEFQSGNSEDSGQITENIANMSASIQQNVAELTKSLEELDKKMSDRLEKSLDGKLEQIGGMLGENSGEQLTEKLSAVEENVHKECVKVYRNVQAVILEESQKQKDAISDVAAGVTNAKRNTGIVLKISIIALVFSLLSIAFQVLSTLNILPF